MFSPSREKKFLWAVIIFFLLILPVFSLAFLNFSAWHGLILALYLPLAGWVSYAFGALKGERDHWIGEGTKTPGVPGADDAQIYHETFLKLRLKEEYDRAHRYRRPFSCLLIEIDSFPELLKSHPSLSGAQINEEMGRFLKKNIRVVDILICQGPERFFAILPETGLLGARITAERIRYLTENNLVRIQTREIRITVSVAVVAFDPALHASAGDIIDSLAKGLAEAKKEGPNRVLVLAEEEG